MAVNKEIVQKVIQYTNELTDKWTRSGSRTKLSAQTNKDARYSFYHFAAMNNLLENAQERLDDVSIPCPFHVDESPSCNLNDRIHKYHCFSCDAGGNIFSFMAEYDRKVNGIDVSYYQKINDCLREDKEMQASVGAASIYDYEEVFSLEDGLKRFKPVLHEEDLPKTFPELASFMLKKGCTVEQQKYAILLMQSGETPEEVYKEVINLNNSVKQEEKNEYNLQEMMLDL